MSTPAPVGDRRRFARLAYDRCGAGEPLVLLHPLGADRAVWRPVLDALAAERDVIAVDLPGFGCSPPLPEEPPPTPRRLALAVAELLAELELDEGRAHVAGNSLGGWVALELAFAGHAASVTAIAPAGLWPRPLLPKPALARTLARALSPVLGPAMACGPLRRVALASVVAHPERVPAQQAAALLRAYASASGFAAVNRAMRAGTFGALSQVDVPVTLLWPQHDRLIARPARLPAGVRQQPLAGCGHIPMWDDPDAVARALLAGSAARS
jgi:pimeloyl-ACP methyl ester carboxylesterase